MIINGNALRIPLADASVQTCVTSPPYFGLRDYGVDGQIGLEQTPDAYVAQLVAVFREVWRVLRDDGTLWLNLGDSYASAWSCNRRSTIGNEAPAYDERVNRLSGGLKEKDLIGIPWRVAFALQADGWYLRSDIIWHKPNPMPESVTDRPTKAHEYVFLLSKSARYYYDADAASESAITDDMRRPYGSPGANMLDPRGKQGEGKLRSKHDTFKREDSKRAAVIPGQTVGTHRPDRAESNWNTTRRNRRSVWSVSTKPYAGAHFATYPPELITPCILAGAPQGGVVLDPFSGSGTTVATARQLGRVGIGVELNPAYIDLAQERNAQATIWEAAANLP